jgi:hypothetical protein
MTGWRLTSLIPAKMRSLSSCFDATRMYRRTERLNVIVRRHRAVVLAVESNKYVIDDRHGFDGQCLSQNESSFP